MMKKLLLLLALAPLGVLAASNFDPMLVTVGIIDNNEPGYRAEIVNPTLERLKERLPEFHFQTVEIAAYQAAEDIQRVRPDFVVAPSDVFLNLINWYGAQAIALRQTSFAADPGRSVGSAVVVLSERRDIRTLSDLRAKKIAASLPDSLGGWLALSGEIKQNGFDPDDFFERVDFMTFQLPDVVNTLTAGYTDAGVLTACQLEIAEASGLLKKGLLRVIDQKDYDGLRCRHSTQLYPDLVFGALNFSRPDLLKRTAITLLTMPAQPSFSWQVAGKFDAVASLYRTLELGQFAPQPWTVKTFLKRFWKELGLILLAVLFLLGNEMRLRRLVTLRTADLVESIAEQKRLTEQERDMRDRLSQMERNSLVSQMSSMIAHELKQPIAAILNYATAMQMRLERLELEDPLLEKAGLSISREAHRMANIVDRVRSYIHRTPARLARCDLSETAAKALKSFQHYAEKHIPVHCTYAASAPVMGDELEIEILILNLLKNAAQAAGSDKNGAVWLTVGVNATQCIVSVRDNGPKLSQEAFERLTHTSESTSPGGLGLGLGIVRSIADEHSATIRLEQAEPNGIIASAVFDRLSDED